MKITAENWKDAEGDLKESGIQDVIYDKHGYVQTIISKSGMRYKLSHDVIKQFVESGVLKLGRRSPNR